MAKTKKVLSLFLVALMTIFTVLSYVPAKAATAAPKLAVVTQPAAEYTPDQTISFTVNAHYAGKVMYRVILYNGTTKTTSNLWNTPKSGYYYTNWTPSGTMNFTIHWAAKQLQPGYYSMTVLAKKVGSKAKYDTYVDTHSFKIADKTATISSIADVTATVDEGGAYTLPATVSAKMSDDTTKDVAVVWTPATVDTTKVGDQTFTGKVEGYDKTVKLTLTVKAVSLTVTSVSANNLAEVVVTFSKPVDKATAEDVGNYSIAGKTIKSASLSDDGKTLTLTMDYSTPLSQQVQYKLTFDNVKCGSAVASVTDYKFTPVDSTLPSVDKVEALGNKTIRVVFNEPVNVANNSSFLLDGTALIGYTKVTQVGAASRTVILKTYSPLAAGNHTLTVKDVQDFVPFKSLSKDFTFTVTEDTTAPSASVLSATFEKVNVKFSEPVDTDTVNASDFYWMQGTTKYYADSVSKTADDQYEVLFTSHKLQYATDLYVSGISDYSGNKMASGTKVSVNPVVDTTRPEVINIVYDSDTTTFTIKFSKNLDTASANKASNYVIKNSDGKEVNKVKYPALQPDGKTVKVVLAESLSEGKTYTIEINNVTDNTTLKNMILPYTKSISVDDTTGPDSSSITANRSANNTVVVMFPEKMAVSGSGSIMEPSKYLYSKDNAATWKALPSAAIMNITSDGKGAIITFPSDVLVANVTDIRVQLVTDLAGNYITGLTKDIHLGMATSPSISGDVKAVDTKTIDVPFSTKILESTINPNDFIVKAGSTQPLNVIAAKLETSNTVALTLADAAELNCNGAFGPGAGTPVTVDVVANATTTSPEGKPISQATGVAVKDAIPAVLDTVSGSTDGKSITLNFEENLDTTAANLTNGVTDLIIKDSDGNLIPTNQYTLSVVDNKLKVTFTPAQSGTITVQVVNPRFLKDYPAGNVIAASDVFEVEADNAGPTFTSTASYANNVIEVTSNEALKLLTASDIKVEVSPNGTFTDSVILVAGTDYSATLKSGDPTKIEITLTTAGESRVVPTAATKFKVTAVSVKDLAGHSVQASYNNAVVGISAYDTVAPTVVSAKMLSATTFQVVFSEPVNATSADFTNYKYDADGAGTTDTPTPIAITSITGNGTNTITVTTNANAGFATGVGTGSVDLGAGIKDLSGNALVSVPGQAIAHD